MIFRLFLGKLCYEKSKKINICRKNLIKRFYLKPCAEISESISLLLTVVFIIPVIFSSLNGADDFIFFIGTLVVLNLVFLLFIFFPLSYTTFKALRIIKNQDRYLDLSFDEAFEGKVLNPSYMYMDNEWFVGAKSFSYIAYNRNYILDITEKENDSFVISYKDGNKDEYSNYFLNQGQKDAFLHGIEKEYRDKIREALMLSFT